MRTLYLRSAAVLFVIMCMSMGVLAQNSNPTKSDTVIIRTANNDSMYYYLRDFGPLSPGDTECHTIFFRNNLSESIIVQGVSAYGQGNSSGFTAKAIPDLPTVMLPNEIVSIANLCFMPGNVATDKVLGTFHINLIIGSKQSYITSQVIGYQTADTFASKPCVTVTMDGNLFGPVIMDGDVSHTITVRSNRHFAMNFVKYSYNDTSYDNDAFLFPDITLPYELAPLEVKTFTVTFSPRSNVGIVKYRYVGDLNWIAAYPVNGGTQICEGILYFPGVAVPPTSPDSATSLAAGSTDVLAMISDNSVTTQTFHFKNNGATDLKITGVALKNGKSFGITDIQPTTTLPFTLASGASMSVTIAMTTVSNGVYYDEVIITAENAIISMEFPLQGLRKNGIQSGVASGKTEQHLGIYPNPSRGDITVDLPGLHNAKIEVLDLLGRVLTRATASDKWIWNSNAPAGTYIIHISGADASSKSFQSYDRFIVGK